MKRYFEPLLGFVSSVGVKGANDIKEITEGINANPDLLNYLLIGILGGLGGLFVKICWGCLKQAFPKLKKIES